MDKKEFLMALGEQYGLKLDPARAAGMAQAGGPLDMVGFIRTVLFQIDVNGYSPADEPDLKPEGLALEEVKK